MSFDALPPAAVARKAAEAGEAKAGMEPLTVFVLAVLAGAFIALGAAFATTTMAGGAALPYGVLRLLGGVTFSLGLILVVVAGAELFTGNNLIVMAWAGGRVPTSKLLANWAIVYAGNFVGAVATAALIYVAKQYEFGHGEVGQTALTVAAAKTNLGWVQAVALGALCNALVCLAVWLSYGARSTADKILAIVFPISAFVAAGFEHSVANMYFVPVAIFIKRDRSFVASLPDAPDVGHVTWSHFLAANLLPVTIGNIVGGAVMVGAIYWWVYLRPSRETAPAATRASV